MIIGKTINWPDPKLPPINLWNVTKQMNRYAKVINGSIIDVFDIIKAFEVSDPALQELIKILLSRGKGLRERDYDEIQSLINKSKELEGIEHE